MEWELRSLPVHLIFSRPNPTFDFALFTLQIIRTRRRPSAWYLTWTSFRVFGGEDKVNAIVLLVR